MSADSNQLRPVIVTTEFRGVFFGYVEGPTAGVDPIHLKDARMAIRWHTSRGLVELAEVGPNPRTLTSAKADVEVRKITAVYEVSETARKAWDALR